MKIEYIYEAGVFGSYKKANAQSNIDNAKKELARDAALNVIENNCDELAELYLDMLTEVNSEINAIFKTFKYKILSRTGKYGFIELSDYVFNIYFGKYYEGDLKREQLLNLIKNIYCNRPAIEYMKSQGCFILPLVDTSYRWVYSDNNYKEIIPYKNMTKTVADTAEKVIKSHLSKFPSYASIIPNKVKIVILENFSIPFNLEDTVMHGSDEEWEFLSYMGVGPKDVDFNYPVGQGSACLNYILNNHTTLVYGCETKLDKSFESILKALAEPSPWMFNKIVLETIETDLPAVSKDKFYGIKLIKFAIVKGLISNERSYYASISLDDNDRKNIKSLNMLKQEVSNNGLDNYVIYPVKRKTK